MIFNIVCSKSLKSEEYKKRLLSVLKAHQYSTKNFEYLFVIGGDGFFLSIFQKYLNLPIKIIFINSGTLGFYSYTDKIIEKDIQKAINSKRYINLDVLKVCVDDKDWYECINDFSFNNNHTTNFTLKVNNILIEHYFGNGFIISTNLGSTARNKSVGGPIVFPNLSTMIFSEIESIQNRYNTSLKSSIVLDNKANIEINIENRNKSFGYFLIDGMEIKNNIMKNNIKINMSTSIAQVLIDTSISSYAKKLKYAFIDKAVK